MRTPNRIRKKSSPRHALRSVVPAAGPKQQRSPDGDSLDNVVSADAARSGSRRAPARTVPPSIVKRSETVRKYSAPALEKGLSILEAVVAAGEPLKTEEVAQAVGRSRNEIYRMLQVLESHDYIVRDERLEGYVPTNKLFRLGMRAAPVVDLLSAALPQMRRLADSAGQSVQLVVPSGSEIVFIARVDSPKVFGFGVNLGYHRPLVLSASGRLLYAFQTRPTQSQWDRRLRASAPSPAEFKSFLADAERVRKAGWLVRRSVTVEGVTDIAAPIFGPNADDCIANLLVPMIRIYGQSLEADDVARLTRAAADQISGQLRHFHPVILDE